MLRAGAGDPTARGCLQRTSQNPTPATFTQNLLPAAPSHSCTSGTQGLCWLAPGRRGRRALLLLYPRKACSEHSILPRQQDECSILPRHRDGHSVLPRHWDRHSVLPRHRDGHSILPRHWDRHSILPRHQDGHSILPRHRDEPWDPSPARCMPPGSIPATPRGGDCTDEQSSSSQTQPGPASVAKPGACRPIATCRRCSIARWRQKPAFGSPAAAGQAGAGRDLGGCGEGWGLRGAAGRRSGLPAGSRCLWHPDQPAAVQPGSRTRLPSISPGLRSVQVLSAEMPAPGLNSRQRSHTAASAAGPQPLTGEFC